MTQKVTLREVALHAGVSYQTVSKVLNHQGSVSKETEERIWSSVRTLGYRPNLIARSLRSQRSHLIGYSCAPARPGEVNPILDQFLHSMTQAAESVGYYILFFPYREGKDWIAGYQELIDTNRVDGFVLSSIEYNDPRLRFLQERGFPFVAFGRSDPDWEFPFVDVDGAAGIRLVVDHLLEQGHRRIAALAWPPESRVGQNRMDGFLEGLAQAGIAPAPEHILYGEGNYTFGWQGACQLLDSPPENRPTAIVTFNDLMAIGAMKAIQDRGLRVGADIAVTGFDDTPMIQYLVPSLTSVRQPISMVGQQVMNILLSILDQKTDRDASALEMQALVKPRLIVRESTQGLTPA